MEVNPYATPTSSYSISQKSYPWKSLLFCAIWGAAILYLLRAGALPDGYRIHVLNESPPFAYPWSGVKTTALLMFGQSIVFYLIIRPESFVLQVSRISSALVANIAMFLFFGLGGMHAPPYYAWLLIWLLLHGVGLVGLLILPVFKSLRG